jgi:hypothetical protein
MAAADPMFAPIIVALLTLFIILFSVSVRYGDTEAEDMTDYGQGEPVVRMVVRFSCPLAARRAQFVPAPAFPVEPR